MSSKQSPADLARETFRQLSASRTQPTPDAYKKLYNEIAGIVSETENTTDTRHVALLKDLLVRTLGLALPGLLTATPELSHESEELARLLKKATTEKECVDIGSRLKNLCFRIEVLKKNDETEQIQLLLSLFKLLLENVTSLLEDDNWLRGQVIVIQQLIAGEIDHRSLLEATKSLKEVVFKQGILKESIDQNKGSVKQLMNLFVERLDIFANTTGEYHDKISIVTKQITQTTNKEDIDKILGDLLSDTLHVQTEAKQSHELMISAQKEVMEAESRIAELEKKLETMSEQVQKDQLTGSLNRRGLDELLERESSRSERRQTPLCLGMLDIDNFKKINDSHGHAAGDGALVHLVNIIKKTLRTTDMVARYGGEEFAIIMPDTPLKDAAETMVRVQRELTKQIFMAGDEHIVITFSAGVAERHPSEDQESLIKRADKAMYEAKAAGKNRVIVAT